MFGTIDETVVACDAMARTYNDEWPGMAILGITLAMKFKSTVSQELSRFGSR